jgi:arabinogalactan oligomer/maltooligosaccharide transport system substrate-binding protein
VARRQRVIKEEGMNTKRIGTRSLAFALAVVALVVAAVAATASARTGATTITFWQTMNDEETTTLKGLITKYEAANSGVKIEVTNVPFDQRDTKFTAAAQAGKAPDIMRAEIADVANWAARGYLSDITKNVTAADKADFLKAAFAYYNYAGKIWGLPQAPDAPALLYNKKLIKAAGLAPNRPPATMAELTTWCNKAGSKKGIFLRGDSYFVQPWIWAWGGGLVNPATKQILVANSKSIAGMTAYKKLFTSKCAFPDKDFANDYGNMQTAFKNGQVAMIVNGPWSTADILSGPAFKSSVNLGIAPVPKGPGGQGSPVGGNGFVLSRNVGDAAAAYKFIYWLTQPAQQAVFAQKNNLLPSRQSAYKLSAVKTNRLIVDFLAQMKVATARPVDPRAGQIYTDFGPNVQKILKGQVSVSKGMNDIANAWKSKLWPAFTIVK